MIKLDTGLHFLIWVSLMNSATKKIYLEKHDMQLFQCTDLLRRTTAFFCSKNGPANESAIFNGNQHDKKGKHYISQVNYQIYSNNSHQKPSLLHDLLNIDEFF